MTFLFPSLWLQTSSLGREKEFWQREGEMARNRKSDGDIMTERRERITCGHHKKGKMMCLSLPSKTSHPFFVQGEFTFVILPMMCRRTEMEGEGSPRLVVLMMMKVLTMSRWWYACFVYEILTYQRWR